MKRVLAAVVLLVVAYGVRVQMRAPAPQPVRAATAVSNDTAVGRGHAVYDRYGCAMCHGADGKGGKMGTRDFASAEVKAETDAQLIDIISKGKGKMPSYTGKLKDTEIKDLVTYIRGLAK